ncbi:MAG: DUF3810 domain-containing protein [Bacteroidota bacterium]
MNKEKQQNEKKNNPLKRKLFSKISIGMVFTLFLLNQILFYIQPFSPESIYFDYTQGYFRIVTLVERIVFSIFPFSVGDLLYLFIVFVVFRTLFRIIISLYKRTYRKILIDSTDFIAMVALILLLVGTQWNWNYRQPSLVDKMNLNSESYDIEQLASFTKKLIRETAFTKENSNFDVFRDDNSSIIDISILGYERMAKKDDFYTYSYPSIKHSMFSKLLPYLGISGYYNPFTAEAQIAKGIPKVQIPFIVNHEIAHQLGIASEAEANFLGYLASKNNPLSSIQYSGNISLLMYCLADLKKNEYNKYDELKESIPQDVIDDIIEISEFWMSHRNEYRKYTDKGYDLFLKSNQQEDGLNSYNKVVSLAIFYSRKK